MKAHEKLFCEVFLERFYGFKKIKVTHMEHTMQIEVAVMGKDGQHVSLKDDSWEFPSETLCSQLRLIAP